MGHQDIDLQCRECSAAFVWTAGEQAFYSEKGLTNQPTRCPECRANKRRLRNEVVTASGSIRIQYPVVCAGCGKEATVPFVPRNERPVYCSNCFDKVRVAETQAVV